MHDFPAPVRRACEVNEPKELLASLISVNNAPFFIVVLILDLTDAVGKRVHNEVNQLANGLADNCADQGLPEVLVLWHVVAIRLVCLAVCIDLDGIVNVRDANARQNRDSDWKDQTRLFLFLSLLLRGCYVWSVRLFCHLKLVLAGF